MLNRILKNCSSLGFRQVKRVMTFVVGMTVVLIGVAMLVLPGPGILVLVGGLTILGIEFEWARRWLRRAHRMLDKVTKRTNHTGK
jgi:tellurite resistance protein TerC